MSEHSEEQQHQGHNCQAFGCPLPGVYSESTLGGSPYACYVHDGRPRNSWDAITLEIKQRAPLFRLLARANDASGMGMHWASIVPMVRNTLTQMGREDLAPDEMESKHWPSFRLRLRSRLRMECVKAAGEAGPRAGADPMRRITELVALLPKQEEVEA